MSADDRLLALIDESADRQVYRIGALVVHAGLRRVLAAELDAVMDRAEREFGIPRDTELHGQEIFQGHGKWRDIEPRERIAVFGWALDAIAFRAQAVLFEAIDRSRFRAAYAHKPDWNEHEAALMFTMERLNEYAIAQRQAFYVFADDCRFAASVTRSLLTYRTSGTWGYRSTKLDRILNIEFIDSKSSRLIQAVDLVTYLKQRIASGRDASKPRVAKANDQLWARVGPIVVRDRVWGP